MDRLEAMSTFLAVVEAGSVSAAARPAIKVLDFAAPRLKRFFEN